MVGADRKFVGALIVPSFGALKNWLQEQQITFTSNADMIKHPKVLEKYQALIEQYNQYFNHVEQIKKFTLLPAEWSIETGEMTPKLSLKRKVVMEKFNAEIEAIYTT